MRRWFRCSLRTLIVCMVLATLPMTWLAVKMHQARKQSARRAVSYLQDLGARSVFQSSATIWSAASAILLVAFSCLFITAHAAADELKIGWAVANLTPDRPVAMRGNVLSEGVKDPITGTALVLEGGCGARAEGVVLVSCDFLWITDGNRYSANLRDKVRALLRESSPEVPSGRVILMATHTHLAPSLQADPTYEDFAAKRIAAAIVKAWGRRKPGGIGYGLGHAALAHQRIVTHQDGSSRMVGSLQRGSTGNEQFSHMEGFEDHAVHLLFTVDKAGELTGLVINTPCPAQVQRGTLLSADFWHEARAELRRRLHEDLFILPQVSAAGDLATSVMVEKQAEKRMQRLRFPELKDSRDRRRRQIAQRLADCVSELLPAVRQQVDFSPALAHTARVLELPLGFPEPEPAAGTLPVELNALRLGEVAMVTNPFELYLDYGVRIKGRSPAVQTFVVELAGSGSYLPTARAVAGGAYGAMPRTCLVGPSAGNALVEASLEMLAELWPVPDANPDSPSEGTR
jgi:hypothetical protein